MKRPYVGIIFVLVTALIACEQTTKPPPKIISFTATPSTLSATADVKLEWVVQNATGLSISPDIGGVEGTSTTFKLNSSKTFTLTAKNDVGQDSKSVEVQLIPNLPVSTFVINNSLEPTISTLPSFSDGKPRVVTTLSDDVGTKADFVQNELTVITADKQAMEGFLVRWQGEIIRSTELSQTTDQAKQTCYLIRVNLTKADPKGLAEDLKKSLPSVRGDYAFASEDGIKLLAIATKENSTSFLVTPNWLSQSQAFIDGSTIEASMSSNSSGMTYANNVNTWNYMQSGGALDTGVTSAWQLLAITNKLNNKIPIAVFDGGIRKSTDIADATMFGEWDQVNNFSCGGKPCLWHGTGTAATAFGIADNNFGSAGSGAPIARRIVVQSPKTDPILFLEYVVNVIGTMGTGKPKVVNLSASFVLPAVPAGFAKPIMSALSLSLRLAGILVVAAAGNDNLNLDEQSCVDLVLEKFCWYKRTSLPCEAQFVLCVGSTQSLNRTKADFSNFGSGIDLFGPGYVWVPDTTDNSDLDKNAVVVDSGTSLSSPFVAGVAGLIWAANPSLSPDEVEQILLNTAHLQNGDSRVPRFVDAFAAVRNTLGSGDFFKDRFEINDTGATGTPLTPGFYDSLSLHNSSDKDFYKLNFTDEKSEVTLDFNYINRLGSLNSAGILSSSNNCGLPRLKKITSSTANNQRTLQYEAAQGSHTLRVGPENQNVYTMNINARGLPMNYDPDEFDTPTRNDSQTQAKQLGFRDEYGNIQANFDNGQDTDWYVIYSQRNQSDQKKAFHFDIDQSDVAISVEAYKLVGGNLVLQAQDDSAADCTKLPSLYLPDGTYYVKVSSTEFKRGGYVFSNRLHVELRNQKFIRPLRIVKLRPTPGGIEYLELLGKSDGNVFAIPGGVKGIQLLGQGFHSQVLNLEGTVQREGQAIKRPALRSSTRADDEAIGEELSFDGLSNTEEYILGVFRTDIPDDLTEEETSRLPVLPYSLKVLSDAAPDQTPPVVKLSVDIPSVLTVKTVTITADAKDDVGVDGVYFYEDSQLVGIDSEAPYTLEKTYSMLRNGTHEYTAKVVDSAGNVAQSLDTVNVGVDITNMILNPEAEWGFGESDVSPPVAIPGFIPVDGLTVLRYGSPNGLPSLDVAAQINGGGNFFAGGTSDISSATQLMNVFDAAALIDSASGVAYELNGYLGGYADQNDYAEVSLLFLNENGIEVGSEKLKPVNVTDRQNQTALLPRQAMGILPVGTRAVQLKVTMTKVETDVRNDGYLDNLRFVLRKP